MTIEYLDLGLTKPATLPLTILEKLLMVIVKADIDPRPATLPTINQVYMAVGASICVDDILHENEIGDSRGDDGRLGSRSQ